MRFALPLLVIGLSVQLALVNWAVPAPYMDEIFHVPQTQRYCAGKWLEWDAKITTLPGLYIAFFAFWKPISLMGDAMIKLCSTEYMRSVNIFFAVGMLYLLSALFGLRTSVASSSLRAVHVLTVPFFAFFFSLYYTDPGSAFWVVALALVQFRFSCRHASLSQSILILVLGAMAIMFRQTNIIWVGFVGGYALMTMLQTGSRISAMIPHAVPYALLGSAFLLFVWANEGIVVGDRSSHEAGLHPVQLLYFAATIAALDAPTVLAAWSARLRARRWRSLAVYCMMAAAASVVAYYVLRFHVTPHRYLLADNRHFTFYLWQRVLAPYGPKLAPLFGFCAASVWMTLSDGGFSVLHRIFYVACAAAALVPAGLFEFRYFIVPYIFYRFLARQPTKRETVVGIVMNLIVHAGALYLFVFAPFAAPDGSVGHFMW